MRMYIEAYRADGSQILGNLDGQAALGTIKNYKRTISYRVLKGRHPYIQRPKYTRVHHWQVVNEHGKCLEVITNETGYGK